MELRISKPLAINAVFKRQQFEMREYICLLSYDENNFAILRFTYQMQKIIIRYMQKVAGKTLVSLG